MGRINLSNFGGFRVNPSPTYVTLVTILFHAFSMQYNCRITCQIYQMILLLLFPVLITLKTSSSPTALTLGIGTFHLPYSLNINVCVWHTYNIQIFSQLSLSFSVSLYYSTLQNASAVLCPVNMPALLPVLPLALFSVYQFVVHAVLFCVD